MMHPPLVINLAASMEHSQGPLALTDMVQSQCFVSRSIALRWIPVAALFTNISSLGSHRVLPYYFSVGTSKATLEAMTKYLAVELAHLKIRVNAVSGGYVETDAFDSFPNKDDMVAAAESTVTTRVLDPQDLANSVAFLCSDEAEMIRGHVLVVDGGVTLTG